MHHLLLSNNLTFFGVSIAFHCPRPSDLHFWSVNPAAQLGENLSVTRVITTGTHL